MSKIIVEVTQEDIDKGERDHCTLCPIALALHRATGEVWDVGNKYVRLKDFGELVVENWDIWEKYLILMPDTAKTFIRIFDKTGQGEPFSFELELK